MTIQQRSMRAKLARQVKVASTLIKLASRLQGCDCTFHPEGVALPLWQYEGESERSIGHVRLGIDFNGCLKIEYVFTLHSGVRQLAGELGLLVLPDRIPRKL